jgi:hypothetical protein
LLSVKTYINTALDIIDVSRWTGQSTDPSFISGQLALLYSNLGEARACLKGSPPGEDPRPQIPGLEWRSDSAKAAVFDPPLPPNLSLHFTIQDASLVLTIRTLISVSGSYTPGTPASGDIPFSLSGLNLRNRLLGFGSRLPTHDEMGEIFQWQGSEVNVQEKVRVESGDPSLISVAAKLSALEHEVGRWKLNLGILRGTEGDD